MESALINTLLGCLAGGLAGIIPGTGLLITLMIAYPYIIGLDLINILCFYIGLANVAQFTGSVSAIYFGVPGESNSIPAVIEGHKLAKQGHGHTAIIGTSLASVTAGVLTLVFLVCMFPLYGHVFEWFYQTTNQLLIFVFALVIFLIASKNKWYVTALLMLIGYSLGKVGFNEFTGQYFLSFGNTDLKTGVPLFPVVVGVLVVPHLLKHYSFNTTISKNLFNKNDILMYFKNLKFGVLGTVVGFFCGLVPGVSTVLATNLAHRITKYMDKTKDGYRALISAEASNNSAILVTLLPLIILGIPITGSEAMLLSIMEMNLIEINWKIILQQNYHHIIALSVLLSLLIGVLLSWPLSHIIQKLLHTVRNNFKIIVAVLLVATLTYVASITGQYFYYTVCFIIFSIAGYLLRRFDVLPFIFVFLIQNKLESVFVVSYNILT
jgi:putative tricarboxylic transport membrane protein